MSNLNYDESTINSIVIQIEMMVSKKRELLDSLNTKYDSFETYSMAIKAKNFDKVYGECVDDYGKVNNIMSEVSEALMDIRTIKKALRTSGLPATVDKRIRTSIEYQTDLLNEFREAVGAIREALSARLRFYNSMNYAIQSKIYGDKC